MVSATSYLSHVEARAYAASRAMDGFDGHDDGSVSGALLRASEALDSHFHFVGSPLSPDQVRAWPRRGIEDRHGHNFTGVPPLIMRAVIELASAYLVSDQEAEQLLGLRGAVATERIGNISIGYQPLAGVQRTLLERLLSPFLVSQSTTRIMRS